MKSGCPSGVSIGGSTGNTRGYLCAMSPALGQSRGPVPHGVGRCQVLGALAGRPASPRGLPSHPSCLSPATGFAHSCLHSMPVACNLTDGITEAEEVFREQTVSFHSLNPRRKVVPDGTDPGDGRQGSETGQYEGRLLRGSVCQMLCTQDLTLSPG